MKAILNRIRQLEKAAVPAQRDKAMVEAILENVRRLRGADYADSLTRKLQGLSDDGRHHDPRPGQRRTKQPATSKA